ncbi:MAG: serine protease [bacterium]
MEKESKEKFNPIIVFFVLSAVVGITFALISVSTKNSNNQSGAPTINVASDSQQEQINSLQKEIDALKNKDTKTIEPTQKSKPDISSVVSEWRDNTAFLICSGVDMYYQPYSQTATAYIHINSINEVYALTNKHAISDKYGLLASRCELSINGNNPVVFFPSVNSDIINSTASEFDIAVFKIDSTNLSLSSLKKGKLCSKNNIKANTGDQIVVIGYPAIGSTKDITATEGIISGYDYPYYVTSAKIEHGNSGGLAILVKDNCFLGVPTGAVTGSIESLGRIFDIAILLQ